ncbi:DUF5691 domain-containing protein [Sphingosinicella sp. BN140058]|uniref:DUF5691 domain-containing protein n=1 Tax=Sphingosinicella sp. BN140058 TaxID=1892855 RepID=UPI00101142D0|nr:DUF5691 domain-containing protein [Sphingosinicella sp. BN140058]QAY78385.1 hypothetical protein ETR14_18980 [Sphingosinicella sp. BN140058]
MIDVTQQALGPVLTRWTTGGAATASAPDELREAILASGAEPELALLALAGQLLGALTVAEPASDLTCLPDLPRPSLPPIAEALRPLARRLLINQRHDGQWRQLLDFLATRGWTMHPGDWMPGANDEDVPDVYAGWRDWAALAGGSDAGRRSGQPLSEESWQDYGPAGRAAALHALRRSDPDAARALLVSRLAGEPADSRLRLVAVLGQRLSLDDQPLLENLLGDRAPKVKALAASLLARLGARGDAGEEAAELADFFSIETKGFLRRAKVLAPRALKTAAQRQRRHELLARIDFPSFAAALGAEPDGLLALWQWGLDEQADNGFATMIAGSASDAIVDAVCTVLSENPATHHGSLVALLPRLSPAARGAVAGRFLTARGGSFAAAAALGAGACRIDDPLRTPAGAALLGQIASEDSGTRAAAAAELHALGLVASRAAAQHALERLTRAGMLSADPTLDMVRLNAGLDDNGVTE